MIAARLLIIAIGCVGLNGVVPPMRAAEIAVLPANALGVQVREGDIAGAKFTIARAANWNGNLLIYAHGYRPESAALSAKLDLQDAAYARLVADGWTVAATSYRRNGMIVRDAIADVVALRDYIAATEGAPALVLLLGESMGGTIVTLIAERMPDRFHGAVAIGAALQARDAVDPIAPNHQPKVPVIFLTNRSEIDGPAAYVEQAAQAPIVPALWTVDRDGHVNVNTAERSLALEGLITWVTANQITRRRDATIADSGGAGGVKIVAGAAHGNVREVTADFGNIFTTFRPADFARLGIEPGERFTLEAGRKTYRIRYGTDYSDVSRGEWIAFPRAEGVILLAINYGNAAAAAGVKAGDALVVRAESRP